MIERVARAIALVTNEPHPLTGAELARAQALAAVGAMREPSETMFMRGGNVPVSNRGDDHKPIRSGRRIGDMAAADAWRTMIDVALMEKPDAPR